MSIPFKDRRLAIIHVDPKFILMMLNMLRNPVRFLQVNTERIPDDAEVISVNANWQRSCIELLIASSQFDVVADGMIPPVIGWGEVNHVVDLREVVKRLDAKDGRGVEEALAES
jgi:hypothetical protein